MKKWGILVIVVLCGLLLSLQLFSRRKSATAPAPASSAKESEDIGVSLPAGATGYVSPADTGAGQAPQVTVAPVQGTGDYTSLMLPALQTQYRGACQEGSLEDMRMAHGRVWGYFARNNPFTFDESKKMYEFASSYVACSALAHGSVDLCGSLPGEANANGVKVDAKLSVSAQCKQKANTLLFLGYLAGKNKNSASCYAAVSGWKQKLLNKVSVQELCSSAAQGMTQFRAYMLKAVPDHDRKIKRTLPVSRSECDGDSECLYNQAAYNALKDSNPSECPRADGGLCVAAVARNAAYCEPIVVDMSKYYCATMEKEKKAHNGYVGMTGQEVKAEIDKVQAEKKQAEKLKAESEKTQAEINKKIKGLVEGE
jgi:hypothetical protein